MTISRDSDKRAYYLAYKERKLRLRKLHRSLKDSKYIQGVYHKIIGSEEEDE